MAALSKDKIDLANAYYYKNIELGSWGINLNSDKRKTRQLAIAGEITNIEEIKNELIQSDCVLHDNTIQEIIFAGYLHWNTGLFSKLQGSFCLAFFDETTEQLIVVRDPIGKKTIYWTNASDYFLFSTDIKSLLATGLIAQTPAIDALAAFFYFGYFPQDLSPIKDVYKLLPGHFLTINLDKQLAIHQYWSLSEKLSQKKQRKFEEYAFEIDQHLETLTHNRPGDLFLKYDMGSFNLASYLPKATKAFNAHFEDSSILEIKGCRHFAQHNEFDFYEKTIYPQETLNELIEFIWMLGEPVVEPIAIENWYMAKLAADSQSKSIYSSIGCEQLFSAQPSSLNINEHATWTNWLAHLLPQGIRKHITSSFIAHISSNYQYRILRNLSLDTSLYSHIMENALFSKHQRRSALPVLSGYFDPEVFAQRFYCISRVDPLERHTYFDIKTLLPDCHLFSLDQACMHHGVKAVTPYIDTAMLEILAGLSDELRLNQNAAIALIKKINEQRLNGSKFQIQYTTSNRMSFIESWRHNSRFRAIFELLKTGLLSEENLVSAKWIKKELGYPHLIPTSFRQLWAILIFEIWFRLFINLPVSNSPPQLSLKELLS